MGAGVTIVLALVFVLLPVSSRATDKGSVLRLAGERLAADQRCTDAIPRLERALDANPDDARAGLILGRCLIRKGDFERASVVLERAAVAEPANASIPVALAVAHFHSGDVLAAEQRRRYRAKLKAKR